MQSVIKQVFMIIGAVVMSLLLYMLVFGQAGRTLMWEALEPVYINEWSEATFNEGNQTSEFLTDTFNTGVDISE